MFKKLYASVTGCSGILGVSVSDSHEMSSATAVITTRTTTLSLGDEVVVNIGYSDNHAQVFVGNVKQLEKSVPDNTYSITLNNVMIRAIDYFIVSSSPDSPMTKQNITAEALIGELMALPGLTNYTHGTTYFTFGITSSFEINLVSVYDFCRMISDVLTWNLWADSDGQIHFVNRKPYVMDGTSGQPGDVADTPTGYVLTDSELDLAYSNSDKDLRNRVVVYGTSNSATAQREVAALPDGFFKSAVLVLGMVDDLDLLQDTADYNLDLLCRTTEAIRAQVQGDPSLACRTVITVDSDILGQSGNWYVYGCEHKLDNTGYICNLELRRMNEEN
jgi:hypothetical protein